MKTIRAGIRSVVAAAVLGLALVACGGGDGAQAAKGVVRGVHAAQGQVTIDHEEIPGMMDAMTMTFDVADPASLDGLEPGAEVDFELIYEGGRYTVTEIAPR